MRRWATVGAVLVLAACASTPTEVTPTQDVSPPVAAAPEPPASVAARDQCGAVELQGLVGKLRTDIPVPIDPTKQRVACTTCPVTMDFSAERLNFFFDAATGVIKEVRCG